MKSKQLFKSIYSNILLVLLLVGLLLSCGDTDGGGNPPATTDASVSISIEVGPTNSVVSVANSINFSYLLYTSSEAGCDITNYTNCANAESNSLSAGMTASITNITEATTSNYYFYLVNPNEVSVQKTLSLQRFSARNSHQVVVVDDTMYVIAGADGGGNKNDVWSSTNGAEWTLVTNSAAFSARFDHQVAVLGDTMYLIGGFDGVDKNDVWSSADGATWTQETPATGFDLRDFEGAAVGSTMYFIGGGDGDGDVWSSTDGANWIQKTSAAAYLNRYAFALVGLGSTMYVVSGYDNNNIPPFATNDVWSSADGGANWIQKTPNTPFTARGGHFVAVVGSTMYLIGGNDGANRLNDVWSSTDGATWTEVTPAAAFSARNDHQVAVLGDTMYLIGGNDGAKKNDVWSSTDGGVTWTEPLYTLSFDY